jgi:hypothetical protein
MTIPKRKPRTPRPSLDTVLAVVRECTAGIALRELVRRARSSVRSTQPVLADALAAGLIVRVGGGARNLVYVAPEYAETVRAMYAPGEARREQLRASKRRARERSFQLIEDLPMRRTIVPASNTPPPSTRGHRSVWDFAAA